MGWASGSEVMDGIIGAAKRHIPDDSARKQFYMEAIHTLENSDWDTQNECEGLDPMFDAALKELHPSWYEDPSP